MVASVRAIPASCRGRTVSPSRCGGRRRGLGAGYFVVAVCVVVPRPSCRSAGDELATPTCSTSARRSLKPPVSSRLARHHAPQLLPRRACVPAPSTAWKIPRRCAASRAFAEFRELRKAGSSTLCGSSSIDRSAVTNATFVVPNRPRISATSVTWSLGDTVAKVKKAGAVRVARSERRRRRRMHQLVHQPVAGRPVVAGASRARRASAER